MALINAQVSGGQIYNWNTPAATLNVTYDSASGSYTLSDSSRSSAFATVIGSSTTETDYSGSHGDQLALYRFPNTGLTYVGLGVWSKSTSDGVTQTTAYNTFTYGNPTPASAMPRTGGAAYNIDLVAYVITPGFETKSLSGSGVFNADFLTGTFNADVFPVETGLVSHQALHGGFEFVAGGVLSSSDSTFSGQVAYVNSTATYDGAISGRLYGPSAQEVGASFTGTNTKNNGGALVGSFFGDYAGGQPGANVDLANLFVSQQFSVAGAELGLHVPPTGAGLQFSVDQFTAAPSGSFTYAHGPGYGFLQDATFTSANIVASSHPNFTTYQETVNGLPLELDLYKPGASNTELALTYTDLGLWYQRPTPPQSPDNETNAFVYGLLTPLTVLNNLSGSGHYTGVVYGNAANLNLATQYFVTGTSTFDVNFNNQTMSGSLNLNGTPVGGGASVGFGMFTFAGAMPANGAFGALSQSTVGTPAGGSVPISLNGTTVGQLQTQAYGPVAQEIGGTFILNYNDSTPNSIAISGATAAKRR